MNTEMLKAAYIPESEWEYCYISDDGMIFTPLYNENGEMLKTGKQAYNDYISSSENTPVPTEQEQINAMLMREIASLKAQVTAQ